MRLSPEQHGRDAAGLTYVYPVLARRSGGVSLGINLNTNSACNWSCIYCQVPGLVLGKAPSVDLPQLASDLRSMLSSILHGDWMREHVPEDARRLSDVAFSGNGEPTSSPQFAEAVEVVREGLDEFGLLGRTKLVLITNGSLIHRSIVQAGVESLAGSGGEAWFKLDSATEEGMAALNQATPGLARVRTNLTQCAGHIPTWIQTCVFARHGKPPSEREQSALIEFLAERLEEGAPLQGVQLYGLARRSHQPAAEELTRLPVEWLQGFAERLRATGLEVRVFA
jgi:wyosine [tRNA(Phe)-imidazoG37] synthetase (radical SAM superfamily)